MRENLELAICYGVEAGDNPPVGKPLASPRGGYRIITKPFYFPGAIHCRNNNSFVYSIPASAHQSLHPQEPIPPFLLSELPPLLSKLFSCPLSILCYQPIFLTAWATMLVLLDRFIPELSLKLLVLSTSILNTAMCVSITASFDQHPTILTVLGTVIGFVLSYCILSAYEWNKEGLKQGSTIFHVSCTLACLIWTHCTYFLCNPTPTEPVTNDEFSEASLRETISSILLNMLLLVSRTTKEVCGSGNLHGCRLHKFPCWTPILLGMPCEMGHQCHFVEFLQATICHLFNDRSGILLSLRLCSRSRLAPHTHQVVPIRVNNQVAIALAKNPIFQQTTKHIDITYHWTREIVRSGKVTLN
ncbi:hypothetical protein VP01_1137g3 [Puccinia sorghi]|uniref:Uncharacterized protein n=1 Tax=Puccinia sorghi TaxID=27349 RepID=A0A0L6VS02_9BASI|nr:hypothetical protein VP01_1137g3 [Puccinia sorghi]